MKKATRNDSQILSQSRVARTKAAIEALREAGHAVEVTGPFMYTVDGRPVDSTELRRMGAEVAQ